MTVNGNCSRKARMFTRKTNFVVFLVNRVLIISLIYRSVPVPDLLLRIQPEHEKETQTYEALYLRIGGLLFKNRRRCI